jgi:hypothetical protein
MGVWKKEFHGEYLDLRERSNNRLEKITQVVLFTEQYDDQMKYKEVSGTYGTHEIRNVYKLH